MMMHRRRLLQGAGAFTLGSLVSPGLVRAAMPLFTVESRTIEVRRKAAKVFGVTDSMGRNGLMAKEGDRFSGDILNKTSDPLVMHWHGQINASSEQDRARPGGGELAAGALDRHDFLLTPGTHWTHAHQLTEQQLLAAPMITREKDAGTIRDVVIMLHDFAYRSPAEILKELGGSSAHGSGHGTGTSPTAGQVPMNHGGQGAMQGMGNMQGMPGMNHGGGMGNMMNMAIHANDVAYDAYLANDRTLDDPEVVRAEKGETLRLRIINGGTATAFHIDTGQLDAHCIAVDGSACEHLRGRLFPLAQGQRIDLLVKMPAEGGAFPVFAQVEADRRRTGIILATVGAVISKASDTANEATPNIGIGLDERLRAKSPLTARKPDRTYHLMLGEDAGYRWTINGKIHGEHEPLEARVGERIAIMFMNPTTMMHPMHLHGHHFQVVGSRAGRFSGPMRDTVIVPPHMPVFVEFDADKAGSWYLHCHHLYHMATGMMTELRVSL